MKYDSPNSGYLKFGFGRDSGSAHMSRTLMLLELQTLLDSVPFSSSSHNAYIHAIEEENCLMKRSKRTRILTRRHLEELFSLDPESVLFRSLKYFWKRDVVGRPLIAALCAFARDPLLRVSFPLISSMHDGELLSRCKLKSHIENVYPNRFSDSTLSSAVRNLSSSWTQAGYLSGRVNKARTQPVATPGSASYALLLGYLRGLRGELLFHSDYAKILDCPFEKATELAEVASRKGWIVFKRIGNVIEVLFPSLLRPREMEWIREQN